MVSPPALEVHVSHSAKEDVTPSEWAHEVMLVRQRLGIHLPAQVRIELEQRMRWHVGLGFHTQLRLAIAAALAFAFSLPIDLLALARLVSRGGTSGIGALGFWYGGVLFDGGRRRPTSTLAFSPSSSSTADESVPLLFHRSSLPFFPVVALGRGWPLVYGETERQLFSELAPIPRNEAAECARAVYMDLQAAAATEDYDAFCEVITELAQIGFKKREINYRGKVAIELTELLRHTGLRGVGMSSWGPACFGFTRDPDMAEHAASLLRREPTVEDAWACEFAPGANVQHVSGPEISALQLAMQHPLGRRGAD